jgi:hypothetical protein
MILKIGKTKIVFKSLNKTSININFFSMINISLKYVNGNKNYQQVFLSIDT